MKIRRVDIINKLKATIAFVKRSLLIMIYLPYFFFRIRNLRHDINKLVDFASSDCGRLLIKPFQDRSEILGLLTTLDKLNPKYILEIGTSRGGTLFLFSRIASEDALLISVDWYYPKWRIPFYKSFAFPNQQIHLIRANSHDKRTLEKVEAILDGNKLDFLLIDGDHTYEGVRKDFEMYAPLVREGGMIAFHDIMERVSHWGVRKFWNEIKPRYEYVEFVEDWKPKRGIGLIKMT